MRTAGVSWKSPEKAEQERPKAALGAGRLRQPRQDRPDGSGHTGRAGRSGQAGSGRVPGLLLGFTPEPGEEKRGEGPEL